MALLLIVDNDRVRRGRLAHDLRQNGYAVVEELYDTPFLNLLKTVHIDLVILEWTDQDLNLTMELMRHLGYHGPVIIHGPVMSECLTGRPEALLGIMVQRHDDHHDLLEAIICQLRRDSGQS